MSEESEETAVPEWLQLPDGQKWADMKPDSALYLDDVAVGLRVTTYIQGKPESTRHYEIIATPDSEDSKGDQVISFRNLETGEETTTSPATIGLTLSPDGHRTCWAIPYDEDA